jgi:hypothetical protein
MEANMRSTAWNESGPARRAALGLSILAGLFMLGGPGDALAQGMSNSMDGTGYRSGKVASGYRSAARPGPRTKGHAFGPGPALKKGYVPRVKGYSYRRPAPRLKRARGYRGAAPRTCGQFRYWSAAKGRCLDARTSPPALK